MKPVTELILVRHTMPLVSGTTAYGQSDVDVGPSFPEDVAAIRRHLPPVDGHAVFSSPLQRCSKLAQALFPPERIRYDERLMEFHFGEWEMREWHEIGHETVSTWIADVENYRPPGGESYACLHARVLTFLGELTAAGTERAVLVTHAGVVRSLTAAILEVPLNNNFRIRIGYGSISRFRVGGEFPAVFELGRDPGCCQEFPTVPAEG